MLYQPSTYIPSVPVVFVLQPKSAPSDKNPETLPGSFLTISNVDWVFFLIDDKQLSIDANFPDITLSSLSPQPNKKTVEKNKTHKFFIYISMIGFILMHGRCNS